jgi:hypothetical protein
MRNYVANHTNRRVFQLFFFFYLLCNFNFSPETLSCNRGVTSTTPTPRIDFCSVGQLLFVEWIGYMERVSLGTAPAN